MSTGNPADPSATGGMDTTNPPLTPLVDGNPTAVPPDGNDNEGVDAAAAPDDGADTDPSVDIAAAPPQPPTKKKESPGCLALLLGASTVGLLVALIVTGFARCGAKFMTVNASDDEAVDCSNAVDFSTNAFRSGRAGAVSFNDGASALYVAGMTVTNDHRCLVESHEVTASDLKEYAGVMMALTPDANGFTPFVEIDGRTVTCNVGSGEVKDCFPKQ